MDNIFSCIFNFIYLTIKFLSCPDIINYLLTESEVCVAKTKLRPCCIDQVIERSMRQSRSLILPVNTESSRLIVIKILLYSICFSKTTNENIRFGAHPGTPITYFNEGDFLGLWKTLGFFLGREKTQGFCWVLYFSSAQINNSISAIYCSWGLFVIIFADTKALRDFFWVDKFWIWDFFGYKIWTSLGPSPPFRH